MKVNRVQRFGRSSGQLGKRERTGAGSIFDRLTWWKFVLVSGSLLTGWYSAAAQVAVRIPDCQRDLYSLEEVDDRLWLAADGHAAFIQKGTTNQTDCDALLSQIPPSTLYVNSLSYLKDHIWLATRVGLYRVGRDNKLIPVPGPSCLSVLNVQLVNKEIWLATEKAAYPLNTMKRTPDLKLNVRRIEYIDKHIWLATTTGAYRIDGNSAVPITGNDLSVHAIKLINGKILLGTQTGLYTYDESTLTLTLVSDKELYVNNIDVIDGQTWLATDTGAYLFESNSLRPLLTQKLNVRDIRRINGKIWFAAGSAARADHPVEPGGLFRLDEGVSISITPYSADSWWKSLLQKILGEDVRVEGVFKAKVRYVGPDGKDFDATVPRQFDVIMTPSETEFNKAVEVKQYTPVDSFERYLAGGRTTIYMRARDKWGNTPKSPTSSGWVIPGPIVLPVMFSAFWLVLLVVAFCLAPYNDFCHEVLMNPFVRRYGSFGVVPLILTLFPFARRHLFRRYFRALRADEEFSEWQTRFVMPTETLLPERLGQALAQKSVLLFLGESGIGKTSYFKYLMGYYALNSSKGLPPGNVVPVFLPLKRHRDKTPGEIFAGQLEKYGGLTDADLNSRFLMKGGFLILIDGLNEVGEKTLGETNSFVDKLRRVNYFCMSSQVTFPDFEGIEKRELHVLDQERIRKLIRARLDEGKADSIINLLDADTYKLYGVPQDLEFAIELVSKNNPLPLTRTELYEATLKPVFDSWKESGQSNYEDLLCHRAYEMLSSRSESFDRKENALPDEIRNDLLENKFLIRRSGQFHFRHDLIRAYLAAKYFTPKWRVLLAQGATVNENWRSMVEFFILQSQSSDQTRDLLYALLENNGRLAKDLFNWIEEQHPGLTENWADGFDRRYGKVSRKRP